MAPDFIFMLTHADRTIPDVQDRLPEGLGAGVRHIGFKDIGLPFADLRRLAGCHSATLSDTLLPGQVGAGLQLPCCGPAKEPADHLKEDVGSGSTDVKGGAAASSTRRTVRRS
jgi:hypothetical protein